MSSCVEWTPAPCSHTEATFNQARSKVEPCQTVCKTSNCVSSAMYMQTGNNCGNFDMIQAHAVRDTGVYDELQKSERDCLTSPT